MLNPTYCGLPLVCKVGTSKNGDFQRILLSLAVGDALEFGKYFRFILQGSGDGSGASLTGASRPALDAFAVMRRAAAEVHYPASPPSTPPRPPPKKKKIKSLVPCLFFICVWTRNRILSLHGLTVKLYAVHVHMHTCTHVHGVVRHGYDVAAKECAALGLRG